MQININDRKTEFLFESDAEKAILREAARKKKPKLYKRIILNTLIISAILSIPTITFFNYKSNELSKLSANIKAPKKTSEVEKMNSFSDKLKEYNNYYNDKYSILVNKANLIDETVPFSTRGTTIERIATVMDIEPEEFGEYRIPQEPILVDEAVETIKEYIKDNKLSVVSFLKSFPRKKRIDIVDLLRGALPIPLDYKELKMIGKVLNMPDEDIYNLWEQRAKQVMESGGMNIYSNSGLVTTMLDCARKYLLNIK